MDQSFSDALPVRNSTAFDEFVCRMTEGRNTTLASYHETENSSVSLLRTPAAIWMESRSGLSAKKFSSSGGFNLCRCHNLNQSCRDRWITHQHRPIERRTRSNPEGCTQTHSVGHRCMNDYICPAISKRYQQKNATNEEWQFHSLLLIRQTIIRLPILICKNNGPFTTEQSQKNHRWGLWRKIVSGNRSR